MPPTPQNTTPRDEQDFTSAGSFTWAKPSGCKMVRIVLGADTASFDVLNIPGGFVHLMLMLYSRSSQAANNSEIRIRFNNDSGGNYSSQYQYGNAATNTAAESISSSSGRIGYNPANSAAANLFGQVTTFIHNYAGATNRKNCLGNFEMQIANTTGGLYVGKAMMGWTSTAAISRITLIDVNGANFKSGSRLSIYGIGVA